MPMAIRELCPAGLDPQCGDEIQGILSSQPAGLHRPGVQKAAFGCRGGWDEDRSVGAGAISGSEGGDGEVEVRQELATVAELPGTAPDQVRDVSLAAKSQCRGDAAEGEQAFVPADPCRQPA